MNRLRALFAFVVSAGFLGILALQAPSPDLIVVIFLTIVLIGYDLARSRGKPKD